MTARDPQRLLNRFAQAGQMNGYVPERTHRALMAYIEEGRPLGHFCTAVVSNNLKGAVMAADVANLPRLQIIVSWLYNNAPAPCWGSPEKVAAWIKHRGLQGGPPSEVEQ